MAIEMALTELEDRIAGIVNDVDKETFIFDFMREMGLPKATVTKLQKGQKAANIATIEGDIWSNKNVYFRKTEKDVLSELMDVQNIVKSKSGNQPRIIMVTDFERLVALDTKLNDTLDIKFLELPQHFDFFLPWQGRERVEFEAENPADIKAAERFAKIYDVLFKDNTEIISVKEGRKTVSKHVFTENTVSETAFNNFLIRALFALFAEDTDIFPRGAFTNVLKTMTNQDGSNMNSILRELFDVLDKPENARGTLANWLGQFPYVNGSLFTEPHEDIVFSAKSRKLIIDAGELIDWTQVNPDIFGSMVQAVTGEDDRSHLGMHYTSVPNIMKVIKPLFLDDLDDQFEAAYNNAKELDKLNDRMSRMKFFDPAAGSGNFLIITYKELRRLEIKIMKRLAELTGSMLYVPIISLKQFYGIEIEEFAADVAKLSLWIAEHQMNVELRSELNGVVRPTLPLQNAGAIIQGNSLRESWASVINYHVNQDTVFVFGNPPYYGSNKQKPEHKADMAFVWGDFKNYKKLDYISGWFKKAADFIELTAANVSFVSTNSIVQGEQVPILWPYVFDKGAEIQFAYRSFKWQNNAKKNAAVIVVVIGLGPKSSKDKTIFDGNIRNLTPHINAYLSGGANVIVDKSTVPLFGLPEIGRGSQPTDGGGLIFSVAQYQEFVAKYPELSHLFKKFKGAEEYINGSFRYILMLNKSEYENYKDLPELVERFEIVTTSRLSSTKAATVKLSGKPWELGENHYRNSQTIVVPAATSENRYYIPIGFESDDVVLSNRVYQIGDAEPWLFGLLVSKMHMVWMKTVAGRLKSDYNYSIGMVYNTFPVPEITDFARKKLTDAALELLDVREELGGSLETLYNFKNMSEELIATHEKLDRIVDSIYRKTPFDTDDKRLEYLFNMYLLRKEEL